MTTYKPVGQFMVEVDDGGATAKQKQIELLRQKEKERTIPKVVDFVQVVQVDPLIGFDSIDIAYHRSRLERLNALISLITVMKEKGIWDVGTKELEEYHKANWAYHSVKWMWEIKNKEDYRPCCAPLICHFHMYCCGFFPWIHGQNYAVPSRLEVLTERKAAPSEFLMRFQGEAEFFSVEQLKAVKDRAETALKSNDSATILVECVALERIYDAHNSELVRSTGNVRSSMSGENSNPVSQEPMSR